MYKHVDHNSYPTKISTHSSCLNQYLQIGMTSHHIIELISYYEIHILYLLHVSWKSFYRLLNAKCKIYAVKKRTLIQRERETTIHIIVGICYQLTTNK